MEEEEDRWAYIYVPSCAAIRTQEIGVLCDVTMNGGVYGGGGGGAAFQISESEVIAPRGDLLAISQPAGWTSGSIGSGGAGQK